MRSHPGISPGILPKYIEDAARRGRSHVGLAVEITWLTRSRVSDMDCRRGTTTSSDDSRAKVDGVEELALGPVAEPDNVAVRVAKERAVPSRPVRIPKDAGHGPDLPLGRLRGDGAAEADRHRAERAGADLAGVEHDENVQDQVLDEDAARTQGGCQPAPHVEGVDGDDGPCCVAGRADAAIRVAQAAKTSPSLTKGAFPRLSSPRRPSLASRTKDSVAWGGSTMVRSCIPGILKKSMTMRT
jgi:hypothetical protein